MHVHPHIPQNTWEQVLQGLYLCISFPDSLNLRHDHGHTKQIHINTTACQGIVWTSDSLEHRSCGGSPRASRSGRHSQARSHHPNQGAGQLRAAPTQASGTSMKTGLGRARAGMSAHGWGQLSRAHGWARQSRAVAELETESYMTVLGRGLVVPSWAEMGSWAVARVGRGPGGGGQRQSGLIVPSGP